MKLKVSGSLSQRDPRWMHITLGYNPPSSKYNIGNYGCLITTIDHYLNSTGKNYTPKTLNEYIKTNSGYEQGTGLFKWIDIDKTKFFYRSERYDGVPTPKSFFDQMKRDLDKGYYLMVEVDFDPTLQGEQMHWVGCFGYDDKGFIIMDPWTGTETYLDVYGDPTNSVFSYRTYETTLEVDKPVSDDVSKLKAENKTLKSKIKDDLEPKIKKAQEQETIYLGTIEAKNIEIKRLTDQKYTVTESLGLLIDAVFNAFNLFRDKGNSSSKLNQKDK